RDDAFRPTSKHTGLYIIDGGRLCHSFCHKCSREIVDRCYASDDDTSSAPWTGPKAFGIPVSSALGRSFDLRLVCGEPRWPRLSSLLLASSPAQKSVDSQYRQ
ncbi:unnamed protein product, partial [Polarella glacialis]